YEYIRETHGFKNIVLANRLSVNNNPDLPCYWVDSSELKLFKETTHIVRFLATAIHELIGHGTGKLLSETSPGTYNFDKQNPPFSPLTREAITSHYLPGQTWGSVFGKLAGTVEECRAILMSMYFMDNKHLLSMFGYSDSSSITAEDRTLQKSKLPNAYFSILKHLLQDADGVISIAHNPTQQSLTVNVDRSKFLSYGKQTLGSYLCKLHIWRCTADVSACSKFYEPLCAVEGVYEEWRKIVVSKPKMKWKFVQPNTFLTGESVQVKVYEETNEGIILSWAERDI
ncbi:hypothetical protein CI102_14882, partial [Trichoderma harzianum]